MSAFEVCNELELFRLFFQFIIVRNCIINEIYKDSNPDGINSGINSGFNLESRIFHWTGAELTFMNNAVNRMKSEQYNTVLSKIFKLKNETQIVSLQNEIKGLIRCFEDTVIWVDLYDEMIKEPVVVKGCFRYKLKHFANAMYKHNMIQTCWGSGKMSDGLKAMLEAIKIYRNHEANNRQRSICDDNFSEIIYYNEVDCRVMWEIIEYIRNNLIEK
jgi:hypothetical protein